MEEGEQVWNEMESGVHILRSQAHPHGHTEGQDQMELCSGDPEHGLGPQFVQEHQDSDVEGIISEHSWSRGKSYNLQHNLLYCPLCHDSVSTFQSMIRNSSWMDDITIVNI